MDYIIVFACGFVVGVVVTIVAVVAADASRRWPWTG